jgi:glycosyltransferase involved in cell wall biosynthesis
MDQIAGHITNYHNLRSVASTDTEIAASWSEISYRRDGGAIEKLRERFMRMVPSYYTGILRATLEMRRGLRRSTYDAIFTNASVAVLFGRDFRRTPTIYDFDATPLQIDRMEGYDNRDDGSILESLKFRLFRDLLQSATLLQAWSGWARRSAIEDYGIAAEKIVVNPPGVNLSWWTPDRGQQDDTGRRPRRVLFVGGDFARKGGQHLLEWYRTQDPARCELHIVTREPVEQRPGVLVYSGMRANTPELLALYQQADVFVLPSLGECFGIATVEAMGAGLPVVTSDVGGTADIVEPGRNGYIVPAASVAELGQALGSILSDDALRRRMAQQSREMAQERFDLERNARQTLSWLKQIAEPGRGFETAKGAGCPVGDTKPRRTRRTRRRYEF